MDKLRFLIVGAHPDDPDICAGGLAIQMAKKGHAVTMLSLTDGSAGHHLMTRAALAERRLAETRRAAAVYGCEYRVLPIPDGALTASLEHRERLLAILRELRPDVVLVHRTCDYHPDHRAAGQLVMDCAYLLGVPLCCPDVPPLRKTPVILSLWDAFTRPTPFRPDVCVPIDGVIERKLDGILCHVSQFYEWLPWCDHWPEIEAAPTFEEKTALLREKEASRFARIAERCQDRLPAGTRYAEAFEWNEYGAPLTDALVNEMTRP